MFYISCNKYGIFIRNMIKNTMNIGCWCEGFLFANKFGTRIKGPVDNESARLIDLQFPTRFPASAPETTAAHAG